MLTQDSIHDVILAWEKRPAQHATLATQTLLDTLACLDQRQMVCAATMATRPIARASIESREHAT